MEAELLQQAARGSFAISDPSAVQVARKLYDQGLIDVELNSEADLSAEQPTLQLVVLGPTPRGLAYLDSLAVHHTP